MRKIAIKVKKAAERSILQGHPWVYESSITKISASGEAGDLAIIFSQKTNRLLSIGLYDPDSVIRIKIIHTGESAQIDQSFFAQKLARAYEIRKPLLETETTAYRLVYGENDELPGLIIDVYNDHAVIKLYTAIWFPYLTYFNDLLQDVYQIETQVLRLSRQLQKTSTSFMDGQVIRGKLMREEVTFLEHGLKFKANLLRGHKTGYFLDHRHNRLNVRTLSRDRRVLDIFSYAGGFSVNAIAGGAKSVLSVDISAQALEIAKANMVLNFEDAHHEIMADDAFKAIEKMRKTGRQFDLIVVDPPSFAKNSEQITGALKSYRKLVGAVVPLLAENAILLMCSCSSRITSPVFFALVEEELDKRKVNYEVMERTYHDEDHPEKIKELSYLKSIYVRV